MSSDDLPNSKPLAGIQWLAGIELALIVAVIAIFAAEPTPDINESHYLTKAKHFWDTHWCDRDLFVGSKDAHWFFFVCFGWLTRLFSLDGSAWILRFLSWSLVAVGWLYLIRSIFARWGMALLTAAGMLLSIRYLHLAGEWIVGGAESKPFAFGLVLLAIGGLNRERWWLVWFCLGLASAFHVLVGGWSTLAVLLTVISNSTLRSSWKQQLVWIALGGGVALAGLIPAWFLSRGGAEVDAVEANLIYVRMRLPHHLYFWAFEKIRLTCFFLGIVAWVALAASGWRNPKIRWLNWFCGFAFLFGLVGLLLSVFSEQGSAPMQRYANSLLRFYWFRLGDAALAFGLPVLLAAKLENLSNANWQKGWKALAAVALACGLYADFQQRWKDSRPTADAISLPESGLESEEQQAEWNQAHLNNWKKLCAWIRGNTENDALFLTPREQQTFVWYAQRAQVVCYKDVPQNAADMLTWRERVDTLFVQRPVWYWRSDAELLELSQKYEVDYLVMPQTAFHKDPAYDGPFELVYPEDRQQNVSYVVFRVPRKQ